MSVPSVAHSTLAKLVQVGSAPNHVLRAALALLAFAMVLVAASYLLTDYPPNIDIEIPLQAADRWVHGGQPYLASAFASSSSSDLPFLYPPPVLPLVALLLVVPRPLLMATWSTAILGAAVFACRRLGIAGRWIPLVLLWPPFAEGILGETSRSSLFGAFVAVFWDPAGRAAVANTNRGVGDRLRTSRSRDPRSSTRPAVADGLLAGLVPALKASLPHPWFALLRRRPSAALTGALVLGVIVGGSIPFLGLGLWRSWLDQLGRASDPSWPLAGASLAHGLPAIVQFAIALGTGLLCFRVPVASLGAWTGLLTVLGAPSLRMFGVLFALPAFLTVRREIALVGAFLVATYTFKGLWMGVLLVTAALVLAGAVPGDARARARKLNWPNRSGHSQLVVRPDPMPVSRVARPWPARILRRR